MLCQRCNQNSANVHITQKLNGQIIEAYLCKSCANKHGGFFEPSININDFISGFVGVENQTKKDSLSKCSKCNMAFSDFKKTSKIGCMKCYEVFSDKLAPIIQNIHGNVSFQGRPPKRNISTENISENSSILEKIQILKIQLNESVQKEEYELAAKLRDEIRDLQ